MTWIKVKLEAAAHAGVMSRKTPQDLALIETARRRRAWFRAQGRSAGRDSRLAAGLGGLDAVAAVAFAGGLALALSHLVEGATAAAPGLALALGAGVARALVSRVAAGAGARAAAAVKDAVRTRIMRGVLRARPGERGSMGEAMGVAVEGVEALDGYYSRFVPARAAAGAAPLLIVAAMALASPVSALVVLATFVPFIAAMALAGGAAAAESRRQFQALTRLSGQFSDRVRALPAVLAFGAEGRATDALAVSAAELSDRTVKVLRIAFVSSGALEFFAALSVALVAVYCGFNLLRLLPFPAPERLDLARAFFVLALAPEVYAPLRRLAAVYHDRQAAEAAVDDLMAAADDAALAPAAPRRVCTAAPAVRFQGVGVTYPGAGDPALSGFDLDVAPGEMVALMGPTGCGKSTALNLLLGLARPTCGAVTVDGAAVGEGARVEASWAGQAPVVAPGTLGQNIALARQDCTAAALLDVARLTGLVEAPGGLERQVDERGGGLSGGERRRLGLARALLRDAPLLLLDEPTANLDHDAEAAMLEVISRAARGRTTLIATHSDAVAALADRVVRLAA